MMWLKAILLVSVVTHGWCSNIQGVKTSETFEHSAVLDNDGNYILFWNFNDTHVTFETHVRTRGWVGFGMSDNGNMFPGDVTVGWVLDDGSVHFSDRHTVGHQMPVLDKSQDWFLLFGEENDFGTVLKFVRKINTCDDAEDEVITEGTARAIFAYGDSDPADDNSITYHGTTRGTKSLSLLTPNVVKDIHPTDTLYYDFLNNNYVVPSDTTTYWCRGFKMPMIGKHHMIKFEAVVTPGNELNVHHMLIYRCKVNSPEIYDGKASLCYGQRAIPQCSNMIIAWAIGGEPFYFPADVGFSIGGPEDDVFYYMETHFDNPTRKANMIDNSGIRITLTTDLRKHEAGMLQLGHVVGYSQIIPPGQKKFVTKTYCSAECLNEGFKQSNLTEIKFIGAVQHSHLIGAAMTTHHYRNGSEIKPLMDDPNYDFNFQAVRPFLREVSARPGDSFRLECTYDSSARTGLTLGGLSTQEEMCLTFAYYYPRMKLEYCYSEPAYDAFGMSRDDVYHTISTADWSNQTIADGIISTINKGHTHQACGGAKFQSPPPQFYKPAEPLNTYVPPAKDCA